MEWLSDPHAWIGLLTLTLLEIVLGIDNIIFISILSGKLPVREQERLGLAMLMRILLLLSLSWIIGLTKPLFAVAGFDVTGKALILIAGGLFLIALSHFGFESNRSARPGLFARLSHDRGRDGGRNFGQIAAVVIAVAAMMIFSGTISAFVERHLTIKMLALSFLLLIGVNLIADGVGFHIPKGYTYFAMGFSVFVELLNLKAKTRLRLRINR